MRAITGKSNDNVTRDTLRFVTGLIVGGVLNLYILFLLRSIIMRRAVGQEAALNSWGILWGDYYGWMIVVALCSLACSACIAGIIARRKGSEVGALTSIPLLTLLLISAYLASGNGSISPGYKIGLIFILLAALPLAIAAGRYGAKAGDSAGNHFDSRANTLLGIKWYHYFWIPFVVSISLKEMWDLMLHSGTLLHVLFVSMTLWLSLYGFRRAYLIISDFDHIESQKARALRFIIFGFCFPLVAYLILRIVLGERVYMSY